MQPDILPIKPQQYPVQVNLPLKTAIPTGEQHLPKKKKDK